MTAQLGYYLYLAELQTPDSHFYLSIKTTTSMQNSWILITKTAATSQPATHQHPHVFDSPASPVSMTVTTNTGTVTTTG